MMGQGTRYKTGLMMQPHTQAKRAMSTDVSCLSCLARLSRPLLIAGLLGSGNVMMAMMAVPALANTNAMGTMTVSIDELNQSVAAGIELPQPQPAKGQHNNSTTGIVKFSSLSPAILAYLASQSTHQASPQAGQASSLTPDMTPLRIVDKQGRVMPMLLRSVNNLEQTSQSLPVVSVATDNPVAVEKLRQAIRLAVDNANNATSLNIELRAFPSNIDLATQFPTENQPMIWWLANPNQTADNSKPIPAGVTSLHHAALVLNLDSLTWSRPLQLQLYGSNDLQSWQMLTQSVVSPFKTNGQQLKTTTQHKFALTAVQAQYKYWQVIASQPTTLAAATLSEDYKQPRYFLTRANFLRDSDAPKGGWRLNVAQPMLTSGITFFVPQNQLWQVSLTPTDEDKNKLSQLLHQPTPASNASQWLGNAQLSSQHSTLIWQPTILQNLSLSGQMMPDNLPVTLLTPVYELLFLAQGTPPYRLTINDKASVAKPLITLASEQITQLPLLGEGQLGPLQPIDDPNATYEQYKQWALWAVLGVILLGLAWLAYRLYQQTTTQRPTQ